MIIPSGYAQINAIHTGAAVPTGAQWTLGVDVSSFPGNVQDIAQTFEIAVNTSGLYAQIANTCNLTSVLVKEGPNATGPSFLEPANEPGTGGTAGAVQVAYLVHKTTDIGGRAGRGRLYLPGVVESKVDVGGVLSSGVASSISTAMSIILSELVAENLTPVLLHASGSPVSTPTPIVAMPCDQVVATQRRRQRR